MVVAVQKVARCFAQPAGFTHFHFAKAGIVEPFRDNTKTGGSAQASAGSNKTVQSDRRARGEGRANGCACPGVKPRMPTATRGQVHEELRAVPRAGWRCWKQHAVVGVATRPSRTGIGRVSAVAALLGPPWHGLCAVCITHCVCVCVWDGREPSRPERT